MIFFQVNEPVSTAVAPNMCRKKAASEDLMFFTNLIQIFYMRGTPFPSSPHRKPHIVLSGLPRLIAKWFTQQEECDVRVCLSLTLWVSLYTMNLSAWMMVSKCCTCRYSHNLFQSTHDYIRDFNTRFSGITASDYTSKAHQSLASIRKSLDAIIDTQTILIGHALENDLKTLRIVHHRCIDTAILFPHPAGAPYRRSLKDLQV
jgi:hypothetical protein